MTAAPTPAQFLADPDPDEPDTEVTIGNGGVLTFFGEERESTDPLRAIASSLHELVGMVQAATREEARAEQLQESRDDLEAKHEVVLELLEEISEIVKGSTSKVSLSVKDAIERYLNPALPEDPEGEDPEQDHPDHDADVEEWREFARSRGYQGPDVDKANRSQIRTMLGIAQPGEES